MPQRVIVAYDLHKASTATYDDVDDVLLECGDSLRIQESVWIVSSNMTIDDIGKSVAKVADVNDNVFVAEFSSTWRSKHAKEQIRVWLNHHPVD